MRYFAAGRGDRCDAQMSGHRWLKQSMAATAAAMLLAAAPSHARAPTPAEARSDIVVQALALLGTPYRYGGTSPASGFDCSGLVRHVFSAVLERDLPRRAEEISAVGHPVSRAELQPGDLVFFNTLRRAFSHVAIYIGDGRFVHAPAARGRVRVEGLDDRYWATRFDGARRVIGPAPSTVRAVPAFRPHGAAGQHPDDDRPPGP
jgi:cell wall-associated NlpC family hydrolase